MAKVMSSGVLAVMRRNPWPGRRAASRGSLACRWAQRMLRSTSPEGFGMHRTTHEGSCHCGNLRWRFETALTLGEIAPRACDCDFCSSHRAAWVSDSQGMLRAEVHHAAGLQRYRQGSQQAEFLMCGTCGVLVAAIACSEDGRLLGAVNRNAFNQRD